MILNISVMNQGKNLHEFASEVNNFFHFEFQYQLFEIGKTTHEYMLSTIEANRKRLGGTGNLTKSIQFQYWTHGYSSGFWIGDIDYLNKNAKYWYWLNYGIAQSGRRIPPSNRGFFAGGLGLSGEQCRPVSGGEGEQWVHTGDKGDYLLKPKKPIEAVNYIENSVHMLINRLAILEAGLNRMIAG